MTKLKTIDGEIHDIKETKDEIDTTCLYENNVNIVCLNREVQKTIYYTDGRVRHVMLYEPVTFIRNNIIMYY
jgi:hypothetical protein